MAQGQPAAQTAVEIRDLRGIKVGSGLTDSAGNFEIHGRAEPGQYIFLAVKAFQMRDEQILLNQPDLEMSLALPAISERVGPKPPRETVSARQLSIPRKARAHLSAAHKNFSRMNLPAARNEIDVAVRIDPVCAPAFSMRAFVELAIGDFAEAIDDARHAVLLDTNDAESYVALGMAYNSQKQFPKAEEALHQALSLRPDSWQAQVEMAKSLYGQGQFVLALRQLDGISEDFPDVHLVRGDVLMSLRRSQEAAQQFSAFLEEAPGDPRRDQIQRIVTSEREAAKATDAAGK